MAILKMGNQARRIYQENRAVSRSKKETLTQVDAKAALDRQKALKDIKLEHIDFLKEHLGLDLRSKDVPLDVVFDIVKGRLSKPVETVVTPLAYDAGSKTKVEMPAIKVLTSLRVQFPKEGEVYVESVPCRPYMEKASGVDDLAARTPRVDDGRRSPTFSEEQLQALEGIGIRRDRIYSGFNHLDLDTKLAIAAGEPFLVDGSVQTSFGAYNVIGEAQLVKDDEGRVSAKFRSCEGEERDENKVIDLLAARVRGSLELDFFERDRKGKIVTNANGVPELNLAGRNIVEFGAAMEPVVGYVHKRVYDKKQGKYSDQVERAYYLVTAQNGNLYPTKMKNVADLNSDGSQAVNVDRKGVEHVVSHPEVSCRLSSDGKVYVDSSAVALAFKSDRDRDDFVRGRGGVVIGAVIGSGTTKRTYEGFAFADNRKGGFAQVFSPETSKVLLERREAADRRKTATARKKQNYGMGI